MRDGLGGRLARVPPRRRRRPPLGRPAVGGGAGRRDRRSSSTPAARSAPVRIRRRASASSCCRRSSRRASSTSAAAPGVLSIAAAKLGFAPVSAIDLDEVAVEIDDARTPPRTASTSELVERDSPSAARGDEHRARRRRRDAAERSPVERAITSGYLDRDEPRVAGLAARSTGASATAGPRTCSNSGRDDFSDRVPRLQGLARRRQRRARAPARGRARGVADAEIAVVNTCCVTNEAVAKSRKAAARAARTHRRVYVDRLRARISARAAFAGLPDNVVVVARRSEDTPAFVAGDVGAIGCVAGRRAPRPRARLRQGAGRLQLLVQLLRHPARAWRLAQQTRRRRPRRDRAACRAGPSRGRAHGHQPRVLSRPRGRLRASAPRTRGRRRPRSRAAAALVDRDQPRRRRARRPRSCRRRR